MLGRIKEWYAKALALAIVAYALSPIDLIPDFVPVLGYLDEVILLPLAIQLAVRLVPAAVMAEHRAAVLTTKRPPASRAGAALIVALWAATGLLLWWLGSERHLVTEIVPGAGPESARQRWHISRQILQLKPQ